MFYRHLFSKTLGANVAFGAFFCNLYRLIKLEYEETDIDRNRANLMGYKALLIFSFEPILGFVRDSG